MDGTGRDTKDAKKKLQQNPRTIGSIFYALSTKQLCNLLRLCGEKNLNKGKQNGNKIHGNKSWKINVDIN